MVSFREVKERIVRTDAVDNNRLHWFSSKFSVLFSFIFINMRISADFATIIFFITGMLGVISFSIDKISYSILGYLLFRLHIIIDMVDGNIARFNNSYSIRGAYWDAVIHSILNPLFYIATCYSMFLQYDNIDFLIISPFIALSSSVLMSVKNNYYKAQYQNYIINQKKDLRPKELTINFKIMFFLSELLSIEGFLIGVIIVKELNIMTLSTSLLKFYLLSNIIISIIKFFQLSYKGKTFSKV